MRLARGFTLIEVMIVVVIVAILAAIGYPSYQNHLRKGARASAQVEMLKVADRQAQHLLDARNYAIGPGALSGTDTPSTPASYTISATPVTGGAQVQDGQLTLTHTGGKTRAGNPGW